MKHFMVLCLVIFLIAGCSERAPVKQPSIPQSSDMQTFVITEEPDTLETAVIAEDYPYDLASHWQEWKEAREAQDRYDSVRNRYDNENKGTFAEDEESRIERYCEEQGFEACRRIDITCEKAGCHEVTVLCEDDDFRIGIDDDSECRSFKIIVEEEIDDRLTDTVEG